METTETEIGGARPLLLTTTAHPTLYQHPDPETGAEIHEHLGRLLTPRHTSSVEATGEAGIPWAADNDCFQGLTEERYTAMLDRIAGVPGCIFVTVPDVTRCVYCDATGDGYDGEAVCACEFERAHPKIVYGDAELTEQRFEEWLPELAKRGLPAALVAQDGLEEREVPWAMITALFIGGSTEWKLGPAAAELAREAKAQGKWVHWGRVNSRKRIAYIVGTGACDSFDGSKWARWRKTYLDQGCQIARELAAEQVEEELVAA